MDWEIRYLVQKNGLTKIEQIFVCASSEAYYRACRVYNIEKIHREKKREKL